MTIVQLAACHEIRALGAARSEVAIRGALHEAGFECIAWLCKAYLERRAMAEVQRFLFYEPSSFRSPHPLSRKEPLPLTRRPLQYHTPTPDDPYDPEWR